MIRYYIIATLIVVAFGSIVFAHRLAPPDLKISAQPSGTPSIASVERRSAATPRPYLGQGPWVLSALPGCFEEQSRISGPAADLAAKIPPAADRVAAGTTLRAGACTLAIGAREIVVTRGTDRLRVPPDAALYRIAGRLTLVARMGKQIEIRRY